MNKILGEKIFLRPICLDDTYLIVKWRNKIYVQENFLFREKFSSDMHIKWMNTNVATGKVVQYIICLNDNMPIGSVYFRDIDKEKNHAEFGIFIGEENLIGKGYGKEATSLFVKYGFDKLGLENIFLRVIEKNEIATHVYEKVGFKKIYQKKEKVCPSGEEVTVSFMEIKKE